MALFSASGYVSAELIASNSVTGFESDNETELEVSSEFELDTENSEYLDNDFFGEGSTGYNDDSAFIETGDIEASVELDNQNNRNVFDIEDWINPDFDVEVYNECTGAFSDNEASAEIESELSVETENDVDLDNDLFLSLNTGYNEGDSWGCGGGCGFGDSEISTGDTETLVALENSVNTNIIEVDAEADVDAEVGNSTTGFNSDNEASLELENSVEVETDNDADIDNDVVVISNTGHNETDSFGGCHGGCGCDVCGFDSEISTGDAETEILIENSANLNSIEIDAGLDVDAEVYNELTGADSDNEAEVEIENEVSVETENDADIDNDVVVVTNTGYNEGNGEISTGDAEAQVEIENVANVNQMELDLGGEINVSASNFGTGADSDNEASVEIENTVEIETVNESNIDNDVVIVSNTGGNENDGWGGAISTGDSSIVFSATNTSNLNSL